MLLILLWFNSVVLTVLCHRWRPCDARALCLPEPWWAVLGSLYDAHKLSRYFSLLRHPHPAPHPSILPVMTKFLLYAFSRTYVCAALHCCHWRIFLVSVCCTGVPLPLLVLRRYCSSQFIISVVSSARTKLPLQSICPPSMCFSGVVARGPPP